MEHGVQPERIYQGSSGSYFVKNINQVLVCYAHVNIVHVHVPSKWYLVEEEWQWRVRLGNCVKNTSCFL